MFRADFQPYYSYRRIRKMLEMCFQTLFTANTTKNIKEPYPAYTLCAHGKNQAPDTTEQNSEHRIQTHKIYHCTKAVFKNLSNADTVQDRRCSGIKMCALKNHSLWQYSLFVYGFIASYPHKKRPSRVFSVCPSERPSLKIKRE